MNVCSVDGAYATGEEGGGKISAEASRGKIRQDLQLQKKGLAWRKKDALSSLPSRSQKKKPRPGRAGAFGPGEDPDEGSMEGESVRKKRTPGGLKERWRIDPTERGGSLYDSCGKGLEGGFRAVLGKKGHFLSLSAPDIGKRLSKETEVDAFRIKRESEREKKRRKKGLSFGNKRSKPSSSWLRPTGEEAFTICGEEKECNKKA